MSASTPQPAQAATRGTRRIPTQARSRARVERILRAAEQLVVRGGVEALSTRAVAESAGVNVASVYQYFADREAIIAALIERHVSAMDASLQDALGSLELVSVRSLTETTVHAYVAGYAARPSYVKLWFQGRVSAEIVAIVFARSEELARAYWSFAIGAGLVSPATPLLPFDLAAKMIDAFLAVAYRDDLSGDDAVVSQGIEMIVRYLEAFATPAGLAGVSRAALARTLDITPG